MRQIPLYGKDAEPDSPLQQIIDEAWGIPRTLDTVPTVANDVLKNHGDAGVRSNTLYFRVQGTIYSIALTVVS